MILSILRAECKWQATRKLLLQMYILANSSEIK